MPQLWPECAWYLEAFYQLSGSRQLGMGTIGYIPIVEIAAWAAIHGVDDTATLVRYVRALDVVYINEWVERQKRDADRAKNQRQADRGTGGP